MSVGPAGSAIATEALSHHTVVPLASYLGLKLKGIAIDEEGMLPDALERACRETAIRGLFLQPSVINPRAAMMSADRRAALVAVAERHDLTIIENDILGPLVDNRPAPIATLAPERTLYMTSFSKITVPGLRIGYLVAPERLAAAVANRHLVTNWMATPIMVEIASRWVKDGTALELVDWQRDALRRRHEIAAEMLDGVGFRSHPCSPHVWLDLPEGIGEESFVAQARIHGVAIAPSASFRTQSRDRGSAVRISLGSTTESQLRAGLSIVHRLLQGDPELLPLPI
jgi:DNA-binding transcriptional MocR family regulator